ncbi:hypothetical protein BH23GEM2_BH23GEM2_23030 [soil metagenome]
MALPRFSRFQSSPCSCSSYTGQKRYLLLVQKSSASTIRATNKVLETDTCPHSRSRSTPVAVAPQNHSPVDWRTNECRNTLAPSVVEPPLDNAPAPSVPRGSHPVELVGSNWPVLERSPPNSARCIHKRANRACLRIDVELRSRCRIRCVRIENAAISIKNKSRSFSHYKEVKAKILTAGGKIGLARQADDGVCRRLHLGQFFRQLLDCLLKG